MLLELKRHTSSAEGIFGWLSGSDQFTYATLEHAYPVGHSFAPKVPVGSYTCKRGLHTLESSIRPFMTFEVIGVLGHTGILFHPGNVNADSAGCILLGLGLSTIKGVHAIVESRLAFTGFMDRLQGLNEFTLNVISEEVV